MNACTSTPVGLKCRLRVKDCCDTSDQRICIFRLDGYNSRSPLRRALSIVSTLYEILELPTGEIVLQRLEGDTEPLVRIRFSDQAKAYMEDASLMIAKAMVEAGIKAINELGQGAATQTAEQPRQLH